MKLIITSLVSFVISVNMMAQVSIKEREALIDLYRFTNGNAWIHQWDLNEKVENWYGVGIVNDKVVSLNNNNLEGELPSSLGNLNNLVDLKLFFNKISGELPNQLGDLKNLESLVVNNNMLSGEIPEGVFKMTRLKKLILSDNYFDEIVNAEPINPKESLKFKDWDYTANTAGYPDRNGQPDKNLEKGISLAQLNNATREGH